MTREELESHPFFADCSIEVGDGWLPVLGGLAVAIETYAPSARAVQAKEKFGELRVYFGAYPEEIEKAEELVRNAAKIASNVCEACGAPGYKAGKRWLKTLCERHHAELDARVSR